MKKNLHQEHLKTREIMPFNKLSKSQEDVAKEAANIVWTRLHEKYPEYDFNNLQSLGLNFLDADFALNYINRGLNVKGLPKRDKKVLQATESSSGIKPDGGIFFVKSKKDGFNLIIGSLEVKQQGEYDGYTPISDADWKRKGGDSKVTKSNRPPQAQGNAIERFAKNANAIKTLTSFYDYNPYVVFCEGFDFHLKSDYIIFKHKPYAKKFEGRDSSIIMRLIAGNDWLPINTTYVDCIKYGETKICPATIYARMSKWKVEEVVNVMLEVIEKALSHLKHIEEI